MSLCIRHKLSKKNFWAKKKNKLCSGKTSLMAWWFWYSAHLTQQQTVQRATAAVRRERDRTAPWFEAPFWSLTVAVTKKSVNSGKVSKRQAIGMHKLKTKKSNIALEPAPLPQPRTKHQKTADAKHGQTHTRGTTPANTIKCTHPTQKKCSCYLGRTW